MATKPNIAAVVADNLRTAILAGDLAPRSKLRLEDLSASFQVSMSPVREALLRLEGRNLVVGEQQRGFVVAETSVDNLEEVMALRCLLEPYALGLALERGTVEWEGRVVSLFHQLSRIEESSTDAVALNQDWERMHREFHLEMLRACGMPMLMDFCGMLYDLGDRYRRLYLTARPPQRNVPKEHAELLRKVVARDPGACELLRTHVGRTSAVLAKFMREHDQP